MKAQTSPILERARQAARVCRERDPFGRALAAIESAARQYPRGSDAAFSAHFWAFLDETSVIPGGAA